MTNPDSITPRREAPEGLVDECGHLSLAPLHLMVTPISGCSGVQVAPEACA